MVRISGGIAANRNKAKLNLRIGGVIINGRNQEVVNLSTLQNAVVAESVPGPLKGKFGLIEWNAFAQSARSYECVGS